METREIWERLITTALKDTVLSADEYNLLKTVLSDLEKYEETLSRALRDGIIDTTEKADLFSQRIQIIRRMFDVANEDNQITDEESDLIRTTQRIINELAAIEEAAPKDF
ncbi:MAG: hypothetical protein ACW99A_20175 [Candidatus Kariarchaeaceae archaeon]